MEDYGLTTAKNAALRHIPIKASGIYRITNTLDGKIYIGSGENIRRRLRAHLRELRDKTHCNRHLQHAFNRDGEHAFIFDVLLLCEKDILIVKEQEFLDTHRPFDDKLGYNICSIAELPPKNVFTPEMRAAMSAARKGIPKSAEHRRKIGEAQKDRTYTKEARKRISETLKKFWADPENRKAQSKRQTGIKRNVPPYSEERKKAISDGRKGKKFPHLRKYKPERIKNWIKMHDEERLSYREISEFVGVHQGVIMHVIKRYLEERKQKKHANPVNNTQ